jgi:DNA-binding MarR family transcriptional regulator
MAMTKFDVLELLETVHVFETKLNLALMYCGLRLPQFRAMVFMEKAGKITVSDLGRQHGITRASASVLVASLTKAGIVESIANQSDKRSFYIKLTELGMTRLQLAKNEVGLVEQRLAEKIPADVLIALNDLARTIHKIN